MDVWLDSRMNSLFFARKDLSYCTRSCVDMDIMVSKKNSALA
jgi:hypothetical protein